jgi:hypothetical protein
MFAETKTKSNGIFVHLSIYTVNYTQHSNILTELNPLLVRKIYNINYISFVTALANTILVITSSSNVTTY